MIGATKGGEVAILYGTANGLNADNPDGQIWTRLDLGATPVSNENFGFVLTAGDINNDGRDDLAIGVACESD